MNDKIIMFKNRLAKVYRHLGKQAKRLGVTCYRIYDHDIPEFPFCIEWYEDKLYVSEYKRQHGLSEDEHETWLLGSLEAIAEVLLVSRENIHLKLRQRKPGRFGQYQKLDDAVQEFVVTENGLQFIVNLSDYLDTGLFLDHRITRQLVREKSSGKKILNLFAYTGSFSVYAAAGGASEIVTVDLSNTYLKWAARNMQLNGFVSEQFSFQQVDVLQYLKTIQADYFDLIIIDPPTFSNSKRMEGFLDVQRDHVGLINDCINGLAPGGLLYFSTNYRKFILDIASIKSSSFKDITKQTTPFDFDGTFSRFCYEIRK